MHFRLIDETPQARAYACFIRGEEFQANKPERAAILV